MHACRETKPSLGSRFADAPTTEHIQLNMNLRQLQLMTAKKFANTKMLETHARNLQMEKPGNCLKPINRTGGKMKPHKNQNAKQNSKFE